MQSDSTQVGRIGKACGFSPTSDTEETERSHRAIRFHGGFGFTDECDAQLYRQRALWCESQHGDALYHRRKLTDPILRGDIPTNGLGTE
jgi:hypothetical protein